MPLLQVPLNIYFPQMPGKLFDYSLLCSFYFSSLTFVNNVLCVDVNVIWKQLEGISAEEMSLLVNQLDSFQVNINNLVQEFSFHLNGLDWTLSSDYHPPAYSDPATTTIYSSHNLSQLLADQISTSKVINCFFFASYQFYSLCLYSL